MKNKDLLEINGVKFTLQEAINFKNNLLACKNIDAIHKKALIERAERVIHTKEAKG